MREPKHITQQRLKTVFSDIAEGKQTVTPARMITMLNTAKSAELITQDDIADALGAQKREVRARLADLHPRSIAPLAQSLSKSMSVALNVA